MQRSDSSEQYGDTGTTGKGPEKIVPLPVMPRQRPPFFSMTWLPSSLLFGVQWPRQGCGCWAMSLFFGGLLITFRERRCDYCRW